MIKVTLEAFQQEDGELVHQVGEFKCHPSNLSVFYLAAEQIVLDDEEDGVYEFLVPLEFLRQQSKIHNFKISQYEYDPDPDPYNWVG
jgi:hypothetical protein